VKTIPGWTGRNKIYDAISAEKLFLVSLFCKVKATTVTVSNCWFDTGKSVFFIYIHIGSIGFFETSYLTHFDTRNILFPEIASYRENDKHFTDLQI